MTTTTDHISKSLTKGYEWAERCKKVTTKGQSNLKMPIILAERPIFIAKADGCRVWDVDGNEYLDFSMSAGASILGHNNPAYIQALKKQLDTIYTVTTGMCQSPLEVELAEKIVKHVPCAERVRFCVTGSDAVQLAIRLARAYTKRRYFIRFEGHYHGWLDNVLGGFTNPDEHQKPFPVTADEDFLSTTGRDPDAFKQSFLLPWNDIEALEKVLAKYGEEVAMIHMEAILCNGECCPPRPGYLEKVRALCDKYGIVLSFDEVITGFRVGLSGAQGLLGVTPDIATFGKAMAGGLPVSAVAGKKAIMDLLVTGGVVGAGTFNGSPLGLAAAVATITELEKDNGAIYKKIDRMQTKLMTGLKEIAKRRNIPTMLQGPRGVFFLLFSNKEAAYSVRELVDLDWEKHIKFLHLMIEEGLFMMFFTRWYISAAVEEKDIDLALEKVDRVYAKL
jgi:glutamate-1-semialdehyde 2,1-aminomutase